MSQLKTNSITNIGNTGDPNITLNSDGSIEVAGDIQSTSQNTGQLAGFRNQIINGDFRIWQRGETFNNTGSGQYLADRWFVLGTGADFSRQTLSSGKPYMRMVAPNVGAAITQRIEIQNLYGFEGKEMTFSASVKTANPSDVEFIGITYRKENGDYISLVVDEVKATGLTANTWGRTSTTFTLPPIPSNAGCLQLGIMNNTTNQTMDVSDFQLEVGPVATPFENRPIGTELALCQRYFESSYVNNVAPGTTVSGNDCVTCTAFMGFNAPSQVYGSDVVYKVTKRSAPTIQVYDLAGNSGQMQWSEAGNPSSQAVASQGNKNGSLFSFQPYSASVTNSGSLNTASLMFTADAEL